MKTDYYASNEYLERAKFKAFPDEVHHCSLFCFQDSIDLVNRRQSKTRSIEVMLSTTSDASYPEEKNMNSGETNGLKKEFECAFSEVLPALHQFLQSEQMSEIFTLHLLEKDRSPSTTVDTLGCCSYWDSKCPCYLCRRCRIQGQNSSIAISGEIDPENLAALLEGIGSILTASDRLQQLGRQRESQPDNIFDVQFLIDPATEVPTRPVVCNWVSNDILQCSNP